MQVKDYEVYDRNGNRATRSNGVLLDGDRMVTKMQLMDGVSPALAEAAALADSIKRNEAFDARQHRPGFVTPQVQDAYAAGDAAREARDARLRDAYKNPPSVTTNTATAIEQVAVVGADAPLAQVQAARDQALAFRDKRLEQAYLAK